MYPQFTHTLHTMNVTLWCVGAQVCGGGSGGGSGLGGSGGGCHCYHHLHLTDDNIKVWTENDPKSGGGQKSSGV